MPVCHLLPWALVLAVCPFCERRGQSESRVPRHPPGFPPVRSLSQHNSSLLLRGIFQVLGLMKMDMVNYTIQSLQPQLQEHSIQFERAQFQERLNKQPSMSDVCKGTFCLHSGREKAD